MKNYKKINGVELRWPKYCSICGRENPIRTEEYYCGNTGKKIVRKYYDFCDIQDCQHDIHDYKGIFKVRCINCGQKVPPVYIEGE